MTEAQKEAQAKLLEWKERRKARTFGSGMHAKKPPQLRPTKGFANDIPAQLQGGHENIMRLRDQLKQLPHTHAVHRVLELKDAVVEPLQPTRGPEAAEDALAIAYAALRVHEEEYEQQLLQLGGARAAPRGAAALADRSRSSSSARAALAAAVRLRAQQPLAVSDPQAQGAPADALFHRISGCRVPPEAVSYVTSEVAARLAQLPQAWGATPAPAPGEELVDWSSSSRDFEVEPGTDEYNEQFLGTLEGSFQSAKATTFGRMDEDPARTAYLGSPADQRWWIPLDPAQMAAMRGTTMPRGQTFALARVIKPVFQETQVYMRMRTEG